jgi:hypothetical protein
MSDMTGHDGTRRDELHTMTLGDLEARVAAAGVLISRRQLMRHCEKGTFEAKKLPALNNLDTWFIVPASVEKGIADIKTLQEQRARRDPTRPDVSGHDGLEKPAPNRQVMTGHDATRPVMTDHVAQEISKNLESDMTGHDGLRPTMSDLLKDKKEEERPTGIDDPCRVTLLEMKLEEKAKQIADKDTQIQFLKEELTDRRDQIRGMREIISEQKNLLETMVAPIFRALAKSVELGALNPSPVKMTTVDVTPGRELTDPPVA